MPRGFAWGQGLIHFTRRNDSRHFFPAFGTASYLPRPSAAEYEFRYVDSKGEVCGRSRSFTFCAPKPLEELETLREEEGEDEEDGDEGLLLVIPRAQLLQVGTTTKAPR